MLAGGAKGPLSRAMCETPACKIVQTVQEVKDAVLQQLVKVQPPYTAKQVTVALIESGMGTDPKTRCVRKEAKILL